LAFEDDLEDLLIHVFGVFGKPFSLGFVIFFALKETLDFSVLNGVLDDED
jgi:hypothetical protein